MFHDLPCDQHMEGTPYKHIDTKDYIYVDPHVRHEDISKEVHHGNGEYYPAGLSLAEIQGQELMMDMSLVRKERISLHLDSIEEHPDHIQERKKEYRIGIYEI